MKAFIYAFMFVLQLVAFGVCTFLWAHGAYTFGQWALHSAFYIVLGNICYLYYKQEQGAWLWPRMIRRKDENVLVRNSGWDKRVFLKSVKRTYDDGMVYHVEQLMNQANDSQLFPVGRLMDLAIENYEYEQKQMMRDSMHSTGCNCGNED